MDFLPLERLRQVQLTRLQAMVQRAYDRVPLFRHCMAAGQLMPDDVRTLDDIRKLPFSEKTDLRDAYPFGLFASPLAEIVRVHASSGTTGKPKALFFSRRDLDRSAELIARCLLATGTTRRDVLQNMMTRGLFTGALVMHYGAEKVGLLVIPAGPGNSERQLLLMQDFRSTVFHTTPSYALYLADFMEQRGIAPRRHLSLKRAFIGAEPYTEETRRKIEQAFGIDVFNSYGLSEMNGPGVAFECQHKNGMHLWEDHFLLEVVAPKTGEPLPDGRTGELVLTTLYREAMPILRYRTRDITCVLPEPCPCGRTHRRIQRIVGRTDDMLIVRGVSIYPQQIERVLMSVPEVGRNYLIILDGLDEMTIKVELAEAGFDGRVERLAQLQNHLVERLRAEILTKPKVEMVAAGSLPISEGKAKRVADKRSL